MLHTMSAKQEAPEKNKTVDMYHSMGATSRVVICSAPDSESGKIQISTTNTIIALA
jgi:hypothetical protein